MLIEALSLVSLQVKTWFQNRRMKHKKLQRKSTDGGSGNDGENEDKGSEHAHSGDDADQSLERIHSDCASDASSIGHQDNDENMDDNEEIDVVSDAAQDATHMEQQNRVVTSQVSQMAPPPVRQPFPIKPTLAGMHTSLLPPSAFLSAAHLAPLALKAKSQ